MVGCGPAGLAAAILLTRDGHRVTIYERFSEAKPIGSGLMLQPSGMAVLQEMGIANAIAVRGARIDALLGLEENGRVALDAPYAKLDLPEAFGLGIHRASLFEVLFDAALGAGVVIRTAHEITSSRAGQNGRRLLFTNGTFSKPYDLVVDASGWASRINSGERSGLLPFGALWATIPVCGSDPHARNLLEQRYRHAVQMVGVLPIGRRGPDHPHEVAFFWSLRQTDYPSWRERPISEWKTDVRALWPQIDFLLNRVASHDDLTFASYAHRTARQAFGDRLIRIGDAWHSASPQLGQGANMALLDAWALAKGLRESRSIYEGLRLAHHLRSEHVRLYQWITAAFTPMFQSDKAWPAWVRDHIMAPLSRLSPVARFQAQLMSGLFAWPLQVLEIDAPDYPAIASSMAARASSLDQS